jgi:hypothetical protein
VRDVDVPHLPSSPSLAFSTTTRTDTTLTQQFPRHPSRGLVERPWAFTPQHHACALSWAAAGPIAAALAVGDMDDATYTLAQDVFSRALSGQAMASAAVACSCPAWVTLVPGMDSPAICFGLMGPRRRLARR